MPSLGTTDVDLVNRALVLLGQDPIQDLTDEDEVSVTCATVYPAVRDEVLGLYPWRCTFKKVQLARLTEAPLNEWTYKFTLPTDRVGEIRTVFNTDEVGAKPFKEYDIIGNELYTDAEEIWVDYPWLINEDSFTGHVRALMVFVLAARLAEPITEDSEKADKWEAKAYGPPGEDGMGGYFARARLLDSTQRPSQEFATNYDLIDVRA